MSVSCLDALDDVVRLVQCSGSAASSTAHYPGIYIDLEHAEPTATELDTYNLVAAGLVQANRILHDLSNYGKGASELVRAAIQAGKGSESETAESAAASALEPLVLRQRDYYRFAGSLERLVGLLLGELCAGPLPALQALEARQGLATQLAGILHFVSRFDALKMVTPALQNDFSFYRRCLARRGLDPARLSSLSSEPGSDLRSSALGADMGQHPEEEGDEVTEDEANLMSFFYAQATPMLERLKSATRSFVAEVSSQLTFAAMHEGWTQSGALQHPEVGRENVVELIGSLGNVCRVMTETPGVESRLSKGEETMDLLLHSLTLCALLYDEMAPGGLADRHSLVDPRLIVRVLRERGRQDLVATIRYQARSLNPASAPSSLRHLFNDV